MDGWISLLPENTCHERLIFGNVGIRKKYGGGIMLSQSSFEPPLDCLSGKKVNGRPRRHPSSSEFSDLESGLGTGAKRSHGDPQEDEKMDPGSDEERSSARSAGSRAHVRFR